MGAVFQLSVLNLLSVLIFFRVNTLSIFSPLTAALHVVDLILHFLLLHCGNLGAFGLSFFFTNNIGK